VADNYERKASERSFHDQRYADETRLRQDKYYAVIRASLNHFRAAVRNAAAGADVLEYGCGAEPHAPSVASEAASVTGIDISEVAIARASAAAGRWLPDSRFLVMDAEQLEFADDSFDLVYGSAIIHHLDLARALREVARVLRPTGKAIFIEPMGHNPIINLYRRLTPKARTPDEHPLRLDDLRLATSLFRESDVRFYHLLSLAAVPLRTTRFFDPALSAFDRADRRLFRSLPRARRLAWYVVLTLEEPSGAPAARPP
jgi:SAM-dependent methyltransferase